MVNQ
jgi:hypothetical protein